MQLQTAAGETQISSDLHSCSSSLSKEGMSQKVAEILCSEYDFGRAPWD